MLIDNIKNYLCDNDYNINIFKNSLYVNNYQNIVYISDNLLIIKFANFSLKVKGTNFSVQKMVSGEILFNGQVEDIKFEYK